MTRIEDLYDRYDWHKRQLETHLRREPFTASLLNERHTRAAMQRISQQIVELGGAAPEPVAIADEIHGLETDAADRFQNLDGLAELHRRQQAAGLEAAHAGDDPREARRRELEQRWDALSGQVQAAYAAGEPGAETGGRGGETLGPRN